jgi:TRAP-type C4-dicarboxylate transport system substrate-binding protein
MRKFKIINKKEGQIMKKLLLALLSVVVVAGLILTGCSSNTSTSTTSAQPATSSSTPAKTYSIRWAHFAAAQLESSVPLTQMCENVKTRTNGRCKIEIFWSDSLVPMFELLDAVRTGSTEMATFPVGAFSNTEITFASAEIPFLYDSIEAQLEGQGALVAPYNKVIEQKYSQKALSVTSIIPLNIGCSKRPIKTLADWKGLMVQSISPITSELTTTFGATGAPASPIDVYELLEKGTVDATIQSLGKFVEAKLWEVCPYVTNAMMVPASAMTTININTWNSLPTDIQDIILDEATKMKASVDEITIQTFYSYLDTLSQNMEVYNLPKAERENWKAAVQSMIDSYMTKMGDFSNDLKSTAEAANKKNPYPY